MLKNIHELTDQELLLEAKKVKSNQIMNAVMIGVLIGIIVYSVLVNRLGFLTVILVFIVYKMVNKTTYSKEELQKILKERKLKL